MYKKLYNCIEQIKTMIFAALQICVTINLLYIFLSPLQVHYKQRLLTIAFWFSNKTIL